MATPATVASGAYARGDRGGRPVRGRHEHRLPGPHADHRGGLPVRPARRRHRARLLRAAARGRRGHRDPRLHALPARAPDAPALPRPRRGDRLLRRAGRAPGRARARRARARLAAGGRGRLLVPVHRRRRRRFRALGTRFLQLPLGDVEHVRARGRRSPGRAGERARAQRRARAPTSCGRRRSSPASSRTATGSALISCGGTRVICTASVQESVPRWMAGQGRGWLTAEYGMLPASTGERKQRDITKGRADGRTIEIQRLIGRSLRGVVDFEALGERTIYVDCDVLTGRRRHPLRVDHRRLRRARARLRAARRGGQARARPAHAERRRGLVRDRRRRAAAGPRLPRGLRAPRSTPTSS